jgi:hypothetical protein
VEEVADIQQSVLPVLQAVHPPHLEVEEVADIQQSVLPVLQAVHPLQLEVEAVEAVEAVLFLTDVDI